MTTTRDRAGHRALVGRLAEAQKSNRGAAGYSRWVNRPLGRQLAATAYRLGLTPNQVSLISAAFTALGVVGVATLDPTVGTAVAVVVVLLVGYALDSADGQLARLRGGGSYAGEWLDHVLDAAKIATFHLAVAISFFRFESGSGAELLLPLGFAAVSSTFFFALILALMLRRIAAATGAVAAPMAPAAPGAQPAPVLRSLLVLPNDYGVLCLVLLLLPAHRAFTVVYGVLLAANTLFLAAGALRWFREMSGLGRAAG